MALPPNAAPSPHPAHSLRQDVTLYSRHLGHVSLSVSVAARDLQGGGGAAERARSAAAVAEAQQRAVAQQAAEQEKLRLQAEGEERSRREAEQRARQDTEQRVAAEAAEAAAAEEGFRRVGLRSGGRARRGELEGGGRRRLFDPGKQ